MTPQKDVIISWNVRGLGTASKWQAIFTSLTRFSPSIICLQETHLLSHTFHYLKKNQFRTQFHSTYTSYSRGVSILIAKTIDFQCRQVRKDSRGQYIFWIVYWLDKDVYWQIFIFHHHILLKFWRNLLCLYPINQIDCV